MSNKLIEAFAINAEIEGMKIMNAERMENGASVAYDEHYFCAKS
jgi:hypothetical protein